MWLFRSYDFETDMCAYMVQVGPLELLLAVSDGSHAPLHQHQQQQQQQHLKLICVLFCTGRAARTSAGGVRWIACTTSPTAAAAAAGS